jgi:hypothetical protein
LAALGPTRSEVMNSAFPFQTHALIFWKKSAKSFFSEIADPVLRLMIVWLYFAACDMNLRDFKLESQLGANWRKA